MKKRISLILVLALIFAFVSCSKEQKEPTPDLQNEEYETIVFNTAEDVNDFLLEGLNPYMIKITDAYKYTQETKSSAPVQVLTLYGYDSMNSEGNKKGYFSQAAADAIGILPGAYIFAREHYHKRFKLSQGQYVLNGYPVDHSKCGFMPTATSQNPTRGFSVEQNGEDVTLTTLIIHIKYEIGTGNSVEVYSPLGYKGINNLTWNIPYIKV